MADLKLSTKGDLQLIQLNSQNKIVKDVVEDPDVLQLLLKRALTTPRGYLTITEINNNLLKFKDNNYGNDIYKELSEGLTLNFLSRVKIHIQNALSEANLDSNIDNIQLNVLEAHTIQILITYTNSSENNIIEVAI